MEKNDFRKLSSEERYSFRKRPRSLIKSGEKKKNIALIMGGRANAVSCWVALYKSQGLKGLRDAKRSVKSEDKKLLSTKQELEIQNMILDTMPDQLKLSYSLWTRKVVKELIAREFNMELALTTTGDYLRSCGYSPQKPKKKAYEQNSKTVQKWLEEEYPTIKQKAKEENVEIHWGDETGVRNNSQHGRSYSPKGRIPVKKSMTKRFSVNIASTVIN